MDGSSALALALGHLHNASGAFIAKEDSSGESLFLAAECMELEGLFADLGIVPELVELGMDAVESVQAASRTLERAPGSVPLELWCAVEALRARASR